MGAAWRIYPSFRASLENPAVYFAASGKQCLTVADWTWERASEEPLGLVLRCRNTTDSGKMLPEGGMESRRLETLRVGLIGGMSGGGSI